MNPNPPQIRQRRPSSESGVILCGRQLFPGGHAESIGKRSTMEDRCAIIGEFAGENTQFYGIFDGHGGSECSSFLAENLHKCISDKIKEGVSVPQAIQESINDLNKVAMDRWKNQGTTLAVVIFINGKLYTANVGDTRIILVNNDGTSKRLSVDHKVSDPLEQEMIEKNGGFVRVGRVCGFLNLSRSIGDGAFEGIISDKPYMTENEFSPDQGLILACDGVWDVLSDNEAVKIFLDAADAAHAALDIKKAAIDRFTSDNVAVICVSLKKKKSSNE